MLIDITAIVKLVIEILVTIASIYFIPWLKVKLGAAKLAKTINTIDILVAAAEQIAKREGYNSDWKKKHVIEMLEKSGFTIDDTIDDYVEAAVLALHNELVNN